MKKSINKYLYTVVLFSANLFALVGPHGGLAVGGSDNSEVCVYCHTPHASNATTLSNVPIWNKPATTRVFKMYGASVAGVAGVTLAGTATDAQPTDATLACLGCHDGISAMNSVINAPGSGGTSATGTLIGGTLQLPRSMGEGDVFAIGGQGLLTDDHPMSIVYTPGKASLRDLTSPLTSFVGANQVSELLRGGKVHCVSCHDPHTSNSRYLRNENTNSALCLGCHNK